MVGRRIVAALAALSLAVTATAVVPLGDVDAAPAEPLRMNHFQAKGSHNSYHIEPPPEAIDLYMLFDADAYTLAYTHPPLTEQLELGFRQFELDVFTDRDGDKFEPIGTPGFKALHIEVVDEGSTCPLFTDCLRELRDWSDDHPNHLPIAVLVELKEPTPPLMPADPITPADLRDLDDEIRSVFAEDRLVTPDYVRGVGRPGGADGAGTVYPDVESAILDHGWPLLEDVRGTFVFVLDNKRNEYVDGDPTLAGRVAFPPSSPGNPDAAFIKMNDPRGAQTALIQERVEAGYMIRTRSDVPVDTGLTGDATRQEAALVSGAHWVSGDYLRDDDWARYDQEFVDRYLPDFEARFGHPFDPDRPAYQTVMPGGTPARCNPVNAPEGCTSTDVEDPDRLAGDPPEVPPGTDPPDPVDPGGPSGGPTHPVAPDPHTAPAGTVRVDDPVGAAPARPLARSPSFTG